MPRALEMVELPKSNHRISHECDHRRTSGQSVKAIGQVDGIGPCGHQEVHPNHEQHDGHGFACELETEKRLFNEAHAGLRTGETGFRRQNQRQYRIDGGKNELADEFTFDCQTFTLLFANLREIVDESQHTHRQHGEQHQQCRP